MNMFRLESEGHEFALKPMNCPESTFIYRSKVRSYRDLPLRLNEYGRLHRNERSGTLLGLTRVRQFIQDDAHVYVRPDQLADEIEAMLGEVREAYSWVGLTPRFAFATKPDKAIGDPALWEQAEGLLKEALDPAGGDYKVKPKDGAFYAPKIDIYIDDALGREWQMATIQADLDDAARAVRPAVHRRERPAAAPDRDPSRDLRLARAVHRHPHRAFRRGFPLWLAPVQAVVIPIADRHVEAADELAGAPALAGPPRRGRSLRQPDAEQDPLRPGAEGACTWSCSATARSRPGRRPPGRGRASSSPPSHGMPSRIDSPRRPAGARSARSVR